MEVIEISSGSESSGVEDVTPPPAWRADEYAAAVREALAKAAALGRATPSSANRKKTQRQKKTARATQSAAASPPRPLARARSAENAQGETSASARTTPAASPTRTDRAATEKKAEEEDRPLDATSAARGGDVASASGGGGTAQTPVRPLPVVPRPVPLDVVDLLSSSDGASARGEKSEEEDEDDDVVLSALARPPRAPTNSTNDRDAQETAKQTKSPVRKRRRLRRFDGPVRTVVEHDSRSQTTVVSAQQSPPRTTKVNKQKQQKKVVRRRRLPSLQSTQDQDDNESWSDESSDASTSSGMESLGSGSHPSALSMSSSEEEKSTKPPMRAGVLSRPPTARKSAPSARHTNFVLGGGSHSAVGCKSVHRVGAFVSQPAEREPASTSGRASASVRETVASPTEPTATPGISSSSLPQSRRSTTSPSREERRRALRNAMMTGVVQSWSDPWPQRHREPETPSQRLVGTVLDVKSTPSAADGSQEQHGQGVGETTSSQSDTFGDDAKEDDGGLSSVCPEVPVMMDLCSSSDESMVASVTSTIDLELYAGAEAIATVARAPSFPARSRASSPDGPRTSTPASLERPSRALGDKKACGRNRSSDPPKRRSSAWRGPIPVRLLGGDSLRPFEKPAVDPLSQFDPSGDLEQKCAVLATFGQVSGHLTSSSYAFEDAESPTRNDRETVEQQVRSILEQELPRIRRCNTRRADAIVIESRSRVNEYLRALESHRSSLLDAALSRRVSCDRRRKISRVPCGHLPLASASQQQDATRIFLYRHGDAGDIDEESIGLLAKVRLVPPFKPLSRSVTCVTVSRNFRVDDDPILRFLPATKDPAELEARRAATQSLALKNTSEFGLPPSALDDEVAEYALRAVVARCGDRDLVFDALKRVAGLTQPYTDYATIKKAHDGSAMTQRRVADAARIVRDTAKDDGPGEPVGLLESINALKPMARKSLSERLAPPPTFFDSHIVRWQLEKPSRGGRRRPRALNVRRTGDYSAMMETYRDFFCRICYCYDCQEHGIEQPQPTRRVDPTYPRLKSQSELRAEQLESEDEESSVDDDDDSDEGSMSEPSGSDKSGHSGSEGRRRSSRSLTVIATTATSNWQQQEHRRRRRRRGQQLAKPAALDETEYLDFALAMQLAGAMEKLLDQSAPCSDACWRAARADATDVARAEEEADMSRDDATRAFVMKLARVVGTNACVIAAAVAVLACRDVHKLLEELAHDGVHEEASRGRRGKKVSRGQGTSGHRHAFDRTRSQRELDHANVHAYEPCNHNGSCSSAACGCVRRDHNCEKACSCPLDCPNRFQGCKCSHGSCRTAGCPCVAAGRECDPDLCRRCGAAEVALFPFKDLVQESPPESGADRPRDRSATCANVHLQSGTRQRIAIGASRTHGFGAFATAPIRRGDFLSEYPGELISQDEAERRGVQYDRASTSYLFDLNEDAVVDAIRVGNKTRFINHDPTHPNCNAKVVRVGPEHRITIWAKRDIRRGEELFFDYGFKPECAPEWSRIQPCNEDEDRQTDKSVQ